MGRALRKRLISLNRTAIYCSLLSCLLFPVIFTSFYAASMGTKGIYSVALLSTIIGLGGGWFLLTLWEEKMQLSVNQLLHSKIEKLSVSDSIAHAQPISLYEQEMQRLTAELENMQIGYEHQINLMQSSVAKSKEEAHQLHLEMDKKLEEMRLAYLEFEDLRKEYQRLEEETLTMQAEAQKNLDHKDALLGEYQRTISEQRMIIEKKQRYIAKLEAKVRDLMYEIRSLLQLDTAPQGDSGKKEGLDFSQQEMIDAYLTTSIASSTPYDYSVQLQKYVEKAESFTGVDHLGYLGGGSPRFLDLSQESYAIDRRRLFDSFKDETGGTVFIYSPAEKKFLFVNPSIKTALGWSPEKFMKEFPHLVVRGYPEWEEWLSKIKSAKACCAKVVILHKSGHSKPCDCYMGLINKGPFAHHILGFLVISGF